MSRFEVWLVNLDPTIGSEIQKTCPAVIVSPDELNSHLKTVVVVPLTTGRAYPFRPATRVQGKEGVAAVDQIRTVDKSRLVRRLGRLDETTANALLNIIGEDVHAVAIYEITAAPPPAAAARLVLANTRRPTAWAS